MDVVEFNKLQGVLYGCVQEKVVEFLRGINGLEYFQYINMLGEQGALRGVLREGLVGLLGTQQHPLTFDNIQAIQDGIGFNWKEVFDKMDAPQGVHKGSYVLQQVRESDIMIAQGASLTA